MAVKRSKAKQKKTRPRARRAGRIHASVEDDLLSLTDHASDPEARWNRPLKQRVSLRMDCEVVDWLKSLGPGYQTRINRILRRMMEGKKRGRKG